MFVLCHLMLKIIFSYLDNLGNKHIFCIKIATIYVIKIYLMNLLFTHSCNLSSCDYMIYYSYLLV